MIPSSETPLWFKMVVELPFKVMPLAATGCRIRGVGWRGGMVLPQAPPLPRALPSIL